MGFNSFKKDPKMMIFGESIQNQYKSTNSSPEQPYPSMSKPPAAPASPAKPGGPSGPVGDLSQFQYEKYDMLGSIKFHARESVRAFTDYKAHINAYLTVTKKEDTQDKIGRFKVSEKMVMMERDVEKIDIGLEELDILSSLDIFCNIMDAERVRTRLQVKRLVQENKWLRSELFELQKRLVKLEDSVVAAEAEKQHYQYVYKMRNQQRADEPSYTIMMDIDEEEDTDPEEEVPTKIKAVHNLCMDYIREKRYEVAIPLLTEHINQMKTKQGESNNDVATLLSIMGKVHKEQGNYAEAQTCYQQSLAMREKVLGKDHNAVGITLTNLAKVAFKRGNFKEADKHAQGALKIREKALGKTHADVANIHAHLGLYAIHLAKWNDAVNHYRVALGVFEQMYDNTDSMLMKAHLNMAKAYVKLKQTDKAAEMIGMVCRSYQQKNSNRADANNTVFQTIQSFADGKAAKVTAESLMKEFGSFENVMDKDVLEIMIEHFTNQKKSEAVDLLKAWTESSEKSPATVVRQSIVGRASKLPSLPDGRSSTVSRKDKDGASVKDGASIMGFFKKLK